MEQPREIWVTKSGKQGLIVSSSKTSPTLGTYENIQRAQEILEEIFQYHRNGKNSYVMPEE